jgi:hypothetical protein
MKHAVPVGAPTTVRQFQNVVTLGAMRTAHRFGSNPPKAKSKFIARADQQKGGEAFPILDGRQRKISVEKKTS